MAITETRNLPAPFIQSLGEYYGKELPALTAKPMDVTQWSPQVAAQDPYQTAAYTQAGKAGEGIGAFEDYISGPTGAEAYTGPDAYKQFMSPYQQQVIDATMTSFDKQAAMQRRGISDRAQQVGAYGGSRMGVAQSEYDAASDMNRALMESQLLQQGYGQAHGRSTDSLWTTNRISRSSSRNVSTRYCDFGYKWAQLQQARAYKQELMQEEKSYECRAYEPYERLGFLGQGLTGIMGGYGNQYQFQQQPNPTPLQTALGTGATLAGIYGALRAWSKQASSSCNEYINFTIFWYDTGT